jgi:hypothetical protein
MSEDAIRVTLKAGTGYDAPWVTIGADTVEEVSNLLITATEQDLFELVVQASQNLLGKQAVFNLAKPAAAVHPSAQALAAVNPIAAVQVAQAAARPAADPSVTTCVHGQRVFREGVGNKGPWSAWFCPTEKGDPTKCKPNFISN